MALAVHALLLIFASMKLQQMEAAAERVSELMKLLANKHRLLVLCQLAEGEKSVGELARLLGVREPAMSQQLSVLRREGTRGSGACGRHRDPHERAPQLAP